jgi:raffinose synthase
MSSLLRSATARRSAGGRISGVPDAVSAAARGPVDGVFLGADFAAPASRHVVSLGAMRYARSPDP